MLAGLGCYHFMAGGGSIQGLASGFALAQGRLVLSGVASVVLTAPGMYATDTVNSPACATTLIVSLGLLPGFVDGATILASVVALYGVHATVRGVLSGLGEDASDP